MLWIVLTVSHGTCFAGTKESAALTSRPLAESSTGTGSQHFQLVSPDDSGVAFVNYLREENNLPFINNGAGVAVGDYDGDGLPDIYLLSTDSANRLYRNLGGFRFDDVTDIAGVDGGEAWSGGATFVDIDNDDDLDLYVCNREARNLLYVNNSDGTFTEAARQFGLDHAASSIMSYFADYDADGDLDMYLVTARALRNSLQEKLLRNMLPPANTVTTWREMNPPLPTSLKNVDESFASRYPEHWRLVGPRLELTGQQDVLFRNEGKGKFVDVTEEAGLVDYAMGLSAMWMDFDNDGLLDLYVANDIQIGDRLYTNNGDGTFREERARFLSHTTWFSMGSDFADVNNDGRFDFLIGDMAGTTHYQSKVMMGSMATYAWFLANEWPRQAMRNAFYLNTGTDRYMEVATLAGVVSSDWTWAVKFGDLDSDGLVDVFITNGAARDDMNPDKAPRGGIIFSEDDSPSAAAEYFASIGPLVNRNIAFRNTGNINFESVGSEWGLDMEGVSFGASYADLDRDGDLDIIVNNLNETASVYRNDTSGKHNILVALRGVKSNRFGLGAIVSIKSRLGEQMRRLFMSRGYKSSDEPVIHFGLGDDSEILELTVLWPSGTTQRFQNLEVDRFYTVHESDGEKGPASPAQQIRPQFTDAGRDSGLTFVHKERMHDDYERQKLLPGKQSQFGPGMAWGDVNGDGRDDVYIGGAAGQSGELYVNQGSGRFRKSDKPSPWSDHLNREDMSILWIDVDSDGDLDLFVASGTSEYAEGDPRQRDRFYLNDGKGAFTNAGKDTLPAASRYSSAAVMADYDQDGDLDIFVGSRSVPGKYPLTANSQLLRNDGGKYVDVTQEVAPDLRRVGIVTAALWSDVDDDGRLDLLVTCEWGAVRLFKNTGSGLVDVTANAGLLDRSGWWNSITGADLDADQDIDYIVLNVGRNTKYGVATAAKPAELFYGDIGRTGSMTLVEAIHKEGRLLPIRGRSCSASAMPFIENKFLSYHSFALADLFDIYLERDLNGAERFQATNFDSGVLINDGTGKFAWRPLPRYAQASPGYGICTADFDADGDVDVYMVQNLFSREAETGLWDGGIGVMLRNDGAGDLQVVDPSETGLVIAGDAKGMAVADIDHDGWPDIVVAQNNDVLRVFRNGGVPGRKSYAVQLRGPKGNTTAVGSRIVVEYAGQAKQTMEIYGGSGYLSQSCSSRFLGSPNGLPPTKVGVRWPDGQRSSHVPDGKSHAIVIHHPRGHKAASL